jgi:hypothetical protein
MGFKLRWKTQSWWDVMGGSWRLHQKQLQCTCFNIPASSGCWKNKHTLKAIPWESDYSSCHSLIWLMTLFILSWMDKREVQTNTKALKEKATNRLTGAPSYLLRMLRKWESFVRGMNGKGQVQKDLSYSMPISTVNPPVCLSYHSNTRRLSVFTHVALCFVGCSLLFCF